MFLLFFLIIGSVSAASDTSDIVNSDISIDTTTQQSNDNNVMDQSTCSDTLSKKEETIPIESVSKVKNYENSVMKEDEKNILRKENENSFTSLNSSINSENKIINLSIDYNFDEEIDGNLKNGITIEKNNIIINGNNHIIDAKKKSKIFTINGTNIIINNLILKNGINIPITILGKNITTNNITFMDCTGGTIPQFSYDGAGTIFVSNSTYTSNNDKFIDNYATAGSAIFTKNSEIIINNGKFKNKNNITWGLIYSMASKIKVINTTFTNISSKYATVIQNNNGETYIKNSQFINLYANKTGGALVFKESNNVTIENCEFINISSNKNGGAIFADIYGTSGRGHGYIIINNTLFTNCSSEFGGAYLQLGGKSTIINSNFTSNYAEFNGGAVYLSYTNSLIKNCTFNHNILNMTYDDYPCYGGAVFCDKSDLILKDSIFNDNHATEGAALYSYDSKYILDNLELNENINPIYTFFDDENSTRTNISGNDTISEDDFNNKYYPSVLSNTGIQIVLINNTINITSLPEKYDLRVEHLVTPVKAQGRMGSCWAFGMTAALESAILKAMNYTSDFSENNMQNTMLQYSQYGSRSAEGGNNRFSSAYFLSWFGAFPQDYDTYDELGKISPVIRTSEDLHIQDIIFIPYIAGNTTSINNVKEAILKYGGLEGNLFAKSRSDENPNTYYNATNFAQYTPTLTNANHAICIVGWDDNFSKNNFNKDYQPPGDGAWIVKNSWGTDWGDGGYFYVSYYDQTLSHYNGKISNCFVGFVIENTNQYNNNYQYDLTGISDTFYENGNPLIYLNNFESIEDDLIAAVGTYFNMEGINYSVEIRVNDNLIYTQSGVSQYMGYHTIKLDKYIPIKKGDKFSATISSNAAPFCKNSRVHYEKGSSLLYSNGVWKDLTEDKTVACLKVYTLPSLIKTDNLKVVTGEELFIVDVNVSNANVIISINNNTLTDTTDENGIVKFKLPKLTNGNYTIITTYNGTSIMNLVEVNNIYNIIEEQSKTIINLTETINNQNQVINKTEEDLKNTQNQINKLTSQLNNLYNKIIILNQTNNQKQTTKNVNKQQTIKIIAPKKTYKSKVKVKKYTVTLKSGKKTINKATITLTIKGKKYKKTLKVKTNTKGKAIFKIKKLSKKETYTAIIIYKGTKKTVKIIVK